MADIQSNINVNVDTSGALASIKALQAQLSAFHTSMAKGSATSAAASSQLQQKLLDSINATGKFNASIQSVKSTTESFTTSLEKNKFSLGQYFKYSIASTKSFGGAFKTEMGVIDKVARERVKSLQTQYISLGRDASGALKAVSIRPLMLDLDNLQTKTALAAQKQQILNQLLKQGSTNLLNFGKNTQWAGRQLMVGFTIPLSMAATAAAKAYMDIEAASIKIKRVYGDLSTTAQETNAMVDSIKNLAAEYTKYGIAVADTMDMAAKAAAMGKTGADLLAQVNQATKLSALGGVDQNAALETTISLTNAFGTSATQLAGKIDFLNAVENQTVTSIEDLTIAIPKAGPIVKQLGGDVEDLTFFLTAMREGGINASEGANALKSGLAAMINPTKKASDMLSGYGINIKAIVDGNKGDLRKTVVDFATALNTIDPLNRARAIEQMFGKFQFARISTLLQNVTASGSQASKAVALANMSSIQLAAMSRKELDKISASPMYKFQKAMADLQVKIAPVGESFLKAVTPIISWVSKILEGFNGMSDQFKSFAVVGAAVVGGLAPVLLMVIGLVANGAANIIKLFANIKSFFNKTTTASKVLGETTSYLTEEQIKAEAVAASLDQIHTKLKQTFTAEAGAVDLLTAALQRSVAAQAASGVGKVASKAAKGYAAGGVVHGPGTSTSDSVPANLSNGEVVLSVDVVKKNPALIGALLSGKKVNVAGYAQSGVAGEKMISKNLPGGAQLAHFGAAGPAMSGREIMANAEAEGEQAVAMATKFLAKEAQMLGVSVEDVLDVTFKTFTNKVTLLASDINNAFGQTGSGSAGSVSGARMKEEVAYRGQEMHGPIASTMKSMGASGDEIKRALDLLDEKTKAAFAQFGDDMQITGDIFDTTMDQIYRETVAELKGSAQTAYDDMSRVRTVESNKANDRKSGNNRVSVSEKSYRGKGAKYIEDVQEVTGTSQTPAASKRMMTRGQKNAFEQIEKTDPALARRLANAKTKEAFAIELENATSGKSTEATKKKTKAVEKDTKAIEEEANVTEQAVTKKKTATKSDAKASTPAVTQATQAAAVQETAKKAGRGPSPFVQRVKASFAAAPSNFANEKRMLTQEAKDIFAQLKNVFKIGGKQATDAVQSGLIQAGPQIKIAGKDAGFDYVTALKGGNGAIAAVVTKGNQAIISKAIAEYNAGGYKIAGAVSLGLDKGIAASLVRGIIAGERLAESVTDGVEKKAKKQKKTTVAPGTMGPLGENEKRGVADKVNNRLATANTKFAGMMEKAQSGISSRFAKIGGAATTAAFAMSMIPGPIGQAMGAITPFIGIMSAASAIMTIFDAEMLTATITIGILEIPVWAIVAALTALAAVVGLAIWGINEYNNAIATAKKKELDQINNNATAYDNAGKAVSEFGKLAGITPGKDAFSVAKTALATGSTGKQASDTNILLQSDEFKDPKSSINALVGNVKAMSDTAAKNFLSSYANQLKGYGFDGKTIQAIINAIEIKAGKTALKLKFASIDISTGEGRAQLEKGVGDAVAGVGVGGVKALNEGRAKNKAEADSSIKGAEDYIKGAQDIKKGPLGFLAGGYFDWQIDAKKGLISGAKDTRNKKDKELLKDPKIAAANSGLKTSVETIKTDISGAFGQFGQGTLTKSGLLGAMTSVQKGLGTGAKGALTLSTAFKQLGNAQTTKLSKTLAGYGKDAGAVTKGFKGTQTQLRYFAIMTNAPGMGKKLNEELNKIANGAGTVATKAIAAQNAINGVFTQVSNNPALVDTVDHTAGDTTGGGGATPADVLKDLQQANAAAILNQKLMGQAYGPDFVSMIAVADKATRDYYTDVNSKGIPVLNAHGKALLKAYNVKVIKDFQTANMLANRNIAQEIAARGYLASAVKSGAMTAAQANEFASRTEVQAMYTLAASTKGAVKKKKAIDDVTKALMGQATAQNNLSKAEIKSAQDSFNETYDKGTKYIDTKIAIINLEFDMDPTNKANKQAILDANNAIQDLQNGVNGKIGLTQYSNALSKLQFREDEINKKYEERQKALDKVAKINQKISEQQKGQLTLAQALASGDIAAAAQAAQDLTAQTAAGSMEEQKTSLEVARQKELDNLTVEINGKKYTRAEIEKASKQIEEDILDIQIKQLAPATTALGLAERTRDAAISTWTMEKSKWDSWKLAIDNAATSLTAYNKLLGEAPGLAGAAKTEVGKTDVGVLTAIRDAAKIKVADLDVQIQSAVANGKWALVGSLGTTITAARAALATAQKNLDDATTVKKAAGGYISGAGTGTSDSIPAMLSNGEYVIKAAAVRKLGVGFLDNLNMAGSGVMPAAFSQGGFVVNKFQPSDLGMDRLSSNNANISSTDITSVLNSVAYTSMQNNTSVSSPTVTDASVYNYSVNVNVRSDANPDQIAQAVIGKINSTNSQRIRGNRFNG